MARRLSHQLKIMSRLQTQFIPHQYHRHQSIVKRNQILNSLLRRLIDKYSKIPKKFLLKQQV
jgi:hypothetical protein